MRYIRIFSTFFFIVATVALQAQDWQLIMDLVISDEGRKFPGAEVSLLKNGNTIETFTANSKGQVDVPIPPDGVYVIKITAPGYVHKKLEIDTRNVNPEDIGEGDIFYRADVEIFENIEGLDLTILDEPIGQIWYDDKFGSFTYNKEYTLNKQAALNKLKESYLEKKEAEQKRLAKNQELYDEAIKKADKAYEAEKWEEAKTYYEQAQGYDPSNTYPSFQLGEIATKIIKNKANQEKYDAAIKLADAALASKNYKEAISQYKRAQGYKPDDQYAAGKIEEAQTLAVESAKIEQNYLAAIEKGDKALVVNDLEAAKAAFEEAQKLKPGENYPTDKLAEISSIQNEKQQIEKEYQLAISNAEKALESKDYATAKSSFEKALGIKPKESYPMEKISEIDTILAKKAKTEQEYLAAVTEADNALSAKNYEEAISAYQTASALKPSEEYPKSKIKEINSFLAANAEKAKQYEEAVKRADEAMAAQDLATAKSSYQKALEIKPGEGYPQQRITEIDNLIAENKAREKEYTEAIASADKAYTAEDYETAKDHYNTALSLKPNENYPKEKVAEIEGLLAKNAEIEEKYNTAITSADEALQSNEYNRAKELFEQALKIKPEESYAKSKLTEINNKLAEITKTESEYQAAITKADELYASKDYKTAIEAYSNALSIKPSESYPSTKIAEIEKIVNQLAAEEEAKRLEEEKLAKVESEYNDAIAKADQLFAEQSWDEAAAAYNEALAVKPDEDYPNSKLADIKKRKQEELAQLKQEELETAYNAAIEKGDKAFGEKNYELAKTSYKNAVDIKGDEVYPAEKLKEIAAIEAELAKADKLKAQQELDENYNVAIQEADALFASEQFEAAKNRYNEALALKPNDTYAAEKLDLIAKKQDSLQQQKAEEQLAKEKAAKLETDYLSAVSLADQAFDNKDYQSAKTNYQEALSLKPQEVYPQQKIQEIEILLSQKAEDEAEKAELAKAKAKTDAEYNALITAADNHLSNGQLQSALEDFQSASILKVNEAYPKNKIEEIQSLIAQKEISEAEDKRQKELLAQKQIEYSAAITEADELYSNEKWEEAISKYKEAQSILSSEEYPQLQIDKINAKIEAEQQLAEHSNKEEAVEKEEISRPTSSITDETEESIDQMYEEMWEEKKSGKENYFAQQKNLVDESNEELRKREEEMKKNAVERLEEISISYKESVKQSNRLNNQNYEMVKNNQEQYASYKKELKIKDQREREKNWNIQQDLADEITSYHNETVEQNTNKYSDELESRRENQSQNILSYRRNQQESREQRNAEYVTLAQEWEDYKNHLKNKFERKNNDRLVEVTEYHQDYSSENIENQQDAIARINEQLEAQAEFIKKEKLEQEAEIEVKAEALKSRKDQLTEMEAKRRSSSERRIQNNDKAEFYMGEAKLREDSLARKYPQGISEEVIEGGNGSTTIRRIVVNDSQADVYTKTLHTWGGVFYTKNGRNITEETWKMETE